LKTFVENPDTDINSNITSLQSQIKTIIVPDYIGVINNINDSILNLQNQMNTLTVHNYLKDISKINDLITNLQSQIDTLSSDTNNHITEINEKLSTAYTNYMELQGQLDTAFTFINLI
jgi:DNA repair exonuclease SbcCD ATPase subunit